MASQSQLGSQATSARVHTEGESHFHQSHSGRQTERGQDGLRWGGDFSRVPPAPEAPPPKKRSGTSQGTPEGRKHPFPPHPPRQWEDPPERPRGEEPPSKGRSKGGKNRQGKHQARGQMTGDQTKVTRNLWEGQAPPSHGCRTSRKDWGGRQARVLLYAGRMMRGPWMPTSMPTTRPVDIRRKGGDLGQDMLGKEPYSTMCSMAMAGKVALVGGGPNCRTWSILRWFPKPGGPPPVRGRADLVGLRGLGAQGYGGHGQRQRAHAPPDVPDLAGLQGARSADGPAGWLLFPGAPDRTRWSAARARAQRGAHRSGSRGPTFNGQGHSTTPSSSSMSAAWARWL